jgi:site-specific DNA-methyltransferase (adenine-specific)
MIDLRLGDCLDILPTLADKSVDAIVTDLPYGTTACKWDVIIPLDAMWKQVKRLCKGAFVTTASQPFTSVLVASNLEWFRDEWIYRKNRATRFLDAKIRPMKNHENILVFGETLPLYNPQMKWVGVKDKRKTFTPNIGREYMRDKINIPHGKDNGYRYPKSVIDINNADSRGMEHPTQKPVALYEYLIKTYTNPGDTVLDFCAGSGTTGVAAIRTGRNAILIEREPEYFAIMERRIHEAQQMELV